jgi:hypothetical protein
LGGVREGADDRFDSLELQITATVMVVGSHRPSVRAAVIMLGFPGEETLDLTILLIGTEDEIRERVIRCREMWGFSNIVVPGDSMEVFAPIDASLARSWCQLKISHDRVGVERQHLQARSP